MSALTHVPFILASVAAWKGIYRLVHTNNLPKEVFNLTHHLTLTTMSWYYLGRSYLFSDAAAATIPAHSRTHASTDALTDIIHNRAVYGDRPVLIAYVFIGYIVVDIMNRKRSARPFTSTDWLHHLMGLAYTAISLAHLPTNFLDAAWVGIQETSSIFLSLMSLGYKHEFVKAAFLATFIFTRVILGGIAAAQRFHWNINGTYPSTSLTFFWCAQLVLNCVFTGMIAKKFLVRKSTAIKA